MSLLRTSKISESIDGPCEKLRQFLLFVDVSETNFLLINVVCGEIFEILFTANAFNQKSFVYYHFKLNF